MKILDRFSISSSSPLELEGTRLPLHANVGFESQSDLTC